MKLKLLVLNSFMLDQKNSLNDNDSLNKKTKKFSFIGFLLSLVNIAFIIVIVVLIRLYIVSPFEVEGISMESNFYSGDKIFIDKVTYGFSSPKRGDVIVFYPPIDSKSDDNGIRCFAVKVFNFATFQKKDNPCVFRNFFIKRVIGIEGDTVEIKNGNVFVTPKNGEKVKVADNFLDNLNKNKTCIPLDDCSDPKNWKGVIVEVEKGFVYVLGDNRKFSSDSRLWSETPLVPVDNIVGKFLFLYWPISHISFDKNFDIL